MNNNIKTCLPFGIIVFLIGLAGFIGSFFDNTLNIDTILLTMFVGIVSLLIYSWSKDYAKQNYRGDE